MTSGVHTSVAADMPGASGEGNVTLMTAPFGTIERERDRLNSAEEL